MTLAIWSVLSLGNRHFAAALMYSGLGLLLWGLHPGATAAQANCNGAEEACPEGQVCCHGTCIPDSHVCCEDGSSGDGQYCLCCTGCEDPECTDPSTVVCADPDEPGE